MKNDNTVGLALLLAVATCAGSVGATYVNKWILGADTKLETNVQLIELAIGILSAPLPEVGPFMKSGLGEDERGMTRDKALRIWAVDTINASAEIKFNDVARSQLIDGTTQLPLGKDSYLSSLMLSPEMLEHVREVNRIIDDMTDEEVSQRLRERANQPPEDNPVP